jgi:fatty-acid desaturase
MDVVKEKSVKDASNKTEPVSRQIWWSNAVFFLAFHIVGMSAWYTWPSSWRTWFLYYINWQLGTLGITIGIFILDKSNGRISSVMES